jgi:uncharacterized protein involved in tolerance to divalent cations
VVVEASISAPDEPTASELSRALVEARLVAGTRITVGRSHYWWNDELCERDYWNVNAYTVAALQPDVTEAVHELHPEETPVVTFHPVEGNGPFERWVCETVDAD